MGFAVAGDLGPGECHGEGSERVARQHGPGVAGGVHARCASLLSDASSGHISAMVVLRGLWHRLDVLCDSCQGLGLSFRAHLVVDSSVLCKRDVQKQVHLQQQVRPAYLVADMKDLASDTAPNLTKGCMVEILPPASTSTAASPAPAAPP